ncbi:MAG: sodium:calcium antiporter [bacterium]|nr:sodium:calcium antiporter [bacterium]
MLWFYILIFIAATFFITISSKMVVSSLSHIARFLGWKEFIVAFFIMAFASSAPNLFLGIISALQGIPELSFGDVMGGNLIDLTVVLAIAVFMSKKGIEAESRIVQSTAIFTVIFALLPFFLITDGVLGRFDGFILILSYFLYSAWLFKRKERFTKVYEENSSANFSSFLRDIGLVALSIVILFFSAQGIIKSAMFFASSFNMSIGLIGILIVGLGNSMPETFFSLISVKRGEGWMVLGNLMGGVVNTATMVLGIVALIHPIIFTNFSPFLISRFFLIIATLVFLLAIRTGHKITKKEGLFLLAIYIIFLIVEILTK